MREIKFRAWDKGVNRIYSSEYMKEMSVFALNSTHSNKDFLVLPIMSDVILMQYTGLKDKNGVEIYCGDIIDTDFYGLKKVPETLQECCIFGLYNTNGNIEVIGNIYENEELLK